jgi:hypothetical protein
MQQHPQPADKHPIIPGIYEAPEARHVAYADGKTPTRGLYEHMPVLDLRVSDPLPTPGQILYAAVHTTPELAQSLLSANHPNQRNTSDRYISKMATDMDLGLYLLNPQPIVIAHDKKAFPKGVLIDGQNRLNSCVLYGKPVWFVYTFGWPVETLRVIDLNRARNGADTLRIEGVQSPRSIAATINKVAYYHETVGSDTQWHVLSAPTPQVVRETYLKDPDGWVDAAYEGARVYKALDLGFTGSVWAAAYAIIAAKHPNKVDDFFTEVREGSSADRRSPTRALRDWAMRRPVSATQTEDTREPLELIIRAFNSWLNDKTWQKVRQYGFTLSHVR